MSESAKESSDTMKVLMTAVAVASMVVVGLFVLCPPEQIVTAQSPRSLEEIRAGDPTTKDDDHELTLAEALAIQQSQEATYARDVSDTRRTVLALVAGFVGVGLGWLNWRRTKTAEGQLAVAQASQTQETFSKAIEHSGIATPTAPASISDSAVFTHLNESQGRRRMTETRSLRCLAHFSVSTTTSAMQLATLR